MNYIINPIWFYVISLLSNIHFVAIASIVLGLFIFTIALFRMFYIYENFNYESNFIKQVYSGYEKENVIVNKIAKVSAIITIVCIFLVCIIPSEETCYKMLIASQVTDENVSKAENIIKDSVDYIFEKLGDK